MCVPSSHTEHTVGLQLKAGLGVKRTEKHQAGWKMWLSTVWVELPRQLGLPFCGSPDAIYMLSG